MGCTTSTATEIETVEEVGPAPKKPTGALALDPSLTTKTIDKQIKKEQKEEAQVTKLLLLGPGGSGKSTIFKQAIHLFGKGFNDRAREEYRPVVFSNTLRSIVTLIKKAGELEVGHPGSPGNAHTGTRPHPECRISNSPQIARACSVLLDSDTTAPLDPQLAECINTVWADPGIKATYGLRSGFQLSDSCAYFFDRVAELSKPDYIPSYEDVLRVRARTTGIVETTIDIQGHKFRLLDVGGQRSERQKWFHCFDGVTAVIFVVALSEYDQCLLEDPQTNRMHEALDLFQELCSSRWFRKTPMILFLNKVDLLEEKAQQVDLNVCFPNYTGGKDFERTREYIKQEFVSRNNIDARHEDLYPHMTCATNQTNIQFTMDAVKDIILKKRLRDGGLMH